MTESEDTREQLNGQNAPNHSVSGSHLSDEEVRQHSMSVYYLICPSLEESIVESKRMTPSAEDIVEDRAEILRSACRGLGVTLESMKRMVSSFFHTFTAYGLFRQSAFAEKLCRISSSLQMKALLAAIFIFACKGDADGHGNVLPRPEQLTASQFGDLANEYIDKALTECGDDPPPLCLLQAMILVTHWMIVKGVRGRAWRSLGLCIRIAFEIGLDSVDSDVDPNSSTIDVDRWCEDEERRRAFWALYELDTFATVMKQVPNVTNWTPNKVLLPADDDKWHQGKPQKSGFLDHDFIERPKTLQQTGTESARAWFIVLISLLAEANLLTRSTSQQAHHAPERKSITSEAELDTATSSRNHRTTLLNSIQLYLLAMPPTLKFYGQMLDFRAQISDLSLATSHLYWQSSIYNVAILAEVARLLALRPYVFEAYVQRLLKVTRKGGNALHEGSADKPVSPSGLSAQELQQCFNASDAMLNVMLSCSEFHYQYLNPCIAYASWLAATVKLLQQELTEDESERRMIRSQFEILKAINGRFIQYWEMSSVPKQNLDELATRLKQFTAVSSGVTETESVSAAQPKNSQRWVGERPRTISGDASGLQVTKHNHSEANPGYKALSGSSTLRKNCSQINLVDAQYQLQQHQEIQRTCNPPLAETNLLWEPNQTFSTQSDLDDQEPLLHGQNQIFPNPTTTTDDSILWFGTTSASWSESRGQANSHAATSSGIDSDSDAQGWSAFTNNNIGGELSEYLDNIFSGPFLG